MWVSYSLLISKVVIVVQLLSCVQLFVTLGITNLGLLRCRRILYHLSIGEAAKYGERLLISELRICA